MIEYILASGLIFAVGCLTYLCIYVLRDARVERYQLRDQTHVLMQDLKPSFPPIPDKVESKGDDSASTAFDVPAEEDAYIMSVIADLQADERKREQ